MDTSYESPTTKIMKRHLLFWSRLSCLSSSDHRTLDQLPCPNVPVVPLPVINLSTVDVQAPVASVDNPHAPWSRDVARLPVVPRGQLLSVDNMKQSVSIETITSNEDSHNS